MKAGGVTRLDEIRNRVNYWRNSEKRCAALMEHAPEDLAALLHVVMVAREIESRYSDGLKIPLSLQRRLSARMAVLNAEMGQLKL